MLLLPTATPPNDKPAGVADIPLPEVDADPPVEELPVAGDFTLAQPLSAKNTIQDVARISATLFICSRLWSKGASLHSQLETFLFFCFSARMNPGSALQLLALGAVLGQRARLTGK